MVARASVMQARRKKALEGSFVDFIKLIKGQSYDWSWHHKHLAETLQEFVCGDIDRLIVSMPPRHGKSEQVSRLLPAYIFALQPNARIIACSYSASLAQLMNEDVQRIMLGDVYHWAFPHASLNPDRVVTELKPKRNRTQFDIIGHSGRYLCAGVAGPVTGVGADYIIIDDPVKSVKESESPLVREQIYRWYQGTLYTRLEKGGKVLLTMTRWHHDDLAGRLIRDAERPNSNAQPWTIVNFPAIKEDDSNPFDQRAIGQPLWESKYNREVLEEIRYNLQSYWYPLYQQKPQSDEGSIFKREWFRTYDPQGVTFRNPSAYVDTSYTSNEGNDRTAIIWYEKKGNDLFIIHSAAVWKEFPEAVKWIQEQAYSIGHPSSKIYVEPKASGLSIIQYLKRHTNLNVIQDKAPTESKEVRAKAVTPFVEAGRVYLPEYAHWLDEFYHEVVGFPKVKHDDILDAFVGSLKKSFRQTLEFV